MTTATVSGQKLRRCWRCQRWKPLTAYYHSRRDPEGRTTTCADCGRALSLAYRAAHLDDVRRRDRDRKRAAAIHHFLSPLETS